MIHLNQDRLNSLSFLDYLKEMHTRIEGIRHTPKSNSAYSESRDLCNDIKHRVVKELHLTWEDWNKRNLRRSEDILDLYSHSDSDKWILRSKFTSISSHSLPCVGSCSS